jgi:hypothetical protein
MNLLLDCVNVPEEDQIMLAKEWAYRSWHTAEVVNNEPNLITTVVSGDSPKIKLEAFNGLQVSSIFTGIHASRDYAASAHFSWYAPPTNAQIFTTENGGTQKGPEFDFEFHVLFTIPYIGCNK